jgi:CRISPR-associated protein Cas1
MVGLPSMKSSCLSDHEASEPLPIGLVRHHVFCPRRAWLEAAGERTDTHQMAVGEHAHRATDDPGTSRNERSRAVDISHSHWGVVGRADTIDTVDGGLKVVEYKATPVSRRPEPTEPMRIQLALQSACLTSMGHTVVEHGVFFTTHQCYVPVAITEADIQAAERTVEATRATLAA